VSGPSRELLGALNATIRLAQSRAGERVPVVGVAGPQGSGKTTLVQQWAQQYAGVAAFSMDDVYRPSSERHEIAERIHPLFATRGPPGTHDLDLLNQTLDQLLRPGPLAAMIPAFDKVADERADPSRWRSFQGSASLVLIDGWCLGARPQADEELLEPINALEAQEDRLRRWRSYANHCLEGSYADVFSRFDAMLYLHAPRFDVIEDWRAEQEEGLLGRRLTEDDRSRISRFVAHFERITRHMLAGGHSADVVAQLDERRGVVAVSIR
jgi:D-glycerate 3-kinase